MPVSMLLVQVKAHSICEYLSEHDYNVQNNLVQVQVGLAGSLKAINFLRLK